MRGSAFDEIFQTDAESDMSTVVIWPKWKPKVEFQYGNMADVWAYSVESQRHRPHCRVLPPGEFNDMSLCRVGLLPLGEFNSLSWSQSHMPPCTVVTWRNQCHRATLQGVRIPCAVNNRFSPYFIIFCFLNVVWDLTSGGFRIVTDTLVTGVCV